MASNSDLRKDIVGLAAELGMEGYSVEKLEKDKLNNKELCELLSDLKAKKRDADLTTEADTPAPVVVEDTPAPVVVEDTPAPVVVEDKPVIAEGKAITSLKGILSEGDDISPEDLSGGQVTFDNLCKKGYITK